MGMAMGGGGFIMPQLRASALPANVARVITDRKRVAAAGHRSGLLRVRGLTRTAPRSVLNNAGFAGTEKDSGSSLLG
jgi:hypothetical protein